MRSSILLLALALLFSGVALAQPVDDFGIAERPDDPLSFTDPTHGPCKYETGASFGLCTVYCETISCDDEDGTQTPFWSSVCNRLRNSFERIAGREVPCDLPCACMTIPEYAHAVEGDGLECIERSGGNTIFLFTTNGWAASTTSGNPIPPHAGCGEFSDYENAPTLDLNIPDGLKCNEHLIEVAAGLGLECLPES